MAKSNEKVVQTAKIILKVIFCNPKWILVVIFKFTTVYRNGMRCCFASFFKHTFVYNVMKMLIYGSGKNGYIKNIISASNIFLLQPSQDHFYKTHVVNIKNMN